MNAALVLQCRSCRTIVGDTLQTIGTFENVCEQSIIATEVARGAMIRRSSTVASCTSGATYHILYCRLCGSILGRTYITMPANAHPELCSNGVLAFDTMALSSYELGSCRDDANALSLDGQEGRDRLQTKVTTEKEESKKLLQSEDISLEPVKELRVKLLEVMTIILSMNERIVKLEDAEGRHKCGEKRRLEE